MAGVTFSFAVCWGWIFVVRIHGQDKSSAQEKSFPVVRRLRILLRVFSTATQLDRAWFLVPRPAKQRNGEGVWSVECRVSVSAGMNHPAAPRAEQGCKMQPDVVRARPLVCRAVMPCPSTAIATISVARAGWAERWTCAMISARGPRRPPPPRPAADTDQSQHQVYSSIRVVRLRAGY